MDDNYIQTGTEAAYIVKEVSKGVNEHVFQEGYMGEKGVSINDKPEQTTGKAAARKAQPAFSGVLKYFPNAIKYVSTVSKAGNDQHHPDKPLHWDMSKSKDELDALTRHLIDHSVDPMDEDEILHLGKVAWRALAALERYLTDNQ